MNKPPLGSSVGRPPSHGAALPRDVRAEIRQTAHRGKTGWVLDLVQGAAQALEDGDDEAVIEMASRAKTDAPRSVTVRKLLGQAHYRLERWKDAARELSAYKRLSGRRDLDHILADSERALGRPDHALTVLDGLRASDVGDETVVEGLIIAAGALNDLGRHEEAVRVLETGPLRPRHVVAYHLRLWYALADTLERAGRRRDARSWWDLIYAEDPDFFDVERRRLRSQS